MDQDYQNQGEAVLIIVSITLRHDVSVYNSHVLWNFYIQSLDVQTLRQSLELCCQMALCAPPSSYLTSIFEAVSSRSTVVSPQKNLKITQCINVSSFLQETFCWCT